MDVEIQNLETRLRSKQKQTAIVPSENQIDVGPVESQEVVPLEKQGPPKVKDELSLFLGTIARDHNWAPLIYIDWHKVPNKDKIWEYVQSKYILPTIAKGWVLATVDWCWGGCKCRLKKLHYYSHSNNNDRWKFRPLNVREAHFKTLLAYWNTQAAKDNYISSIQPFEGML